jgi:hypothetical protein
MFAKARVTLVGYKPIMLTYNSRIVLEHFKCLSLSEKEKISNLQGENEVKNFYLPPKYISECLFAIFSKIKKEEKMNWIPKILGGVVILDHFLSMDEELIKPAYLPIDSSTNMPSHKKNEIFSTSSVNWKASFQFVWDKTAISKEQIVFALCSAGAHIGLGDCCQFGFGRFIVEDVIFDV